MPTVNQVIEHAIDAYVSEINSFYEGFVKQYLPAMAERIVSELGQNGYVVTVKKSPPKKATDPDCKCTTKKNAKKPKS